MKLAIEVSTEQVFSIRLEQAGIHTVQFVEQMFAVKPKTK